MMKTQRLQGFLPFLTAEVFEPPLFSAFQRQSNSIGVSKAFLEDLLEETPKIQCLAVHFSALPRAASGFFFCLYYSINRTLFQGVCIFQDTQKLDLCIFSDSQNLKLCIFLKHESFCTIRIGIKFTNYFGKALVKSLEKVYNISNEVMVWIKQRI